MSYKFIFFSSCKHDYVNPYCTTTKSSFFFHHLVPGTFHGSFIMTFFDNHAEKCQYRINVISTSFIDYMQSPCHVKTCNIYLKKVQEFKLHPGF